MNRIITLATVLLGLHAGVRSQVVSQDSDSVDAPPIETGVSDILDDEARFAALVRQSEGHELQGVEVELADGTPAYLSVPASEAGSRPWPAVVVVDASLRLDPIQRLWADRLAAAGFAALAIDLQQPDEFPLRSDESAIPANDRLDPGHPSAPASGSAAVAARAVDPERARTILRQAGTFLRKDPRVLAPRVAALGWSQGADHVLRAGCMDGGYDALVLYYGRVETNAPDLVGLHAPILGLYGRTDRHHPPSLIGLFEQQLDHATIRADLHVLEAGHRFAEPDHPGYVPEAAAQAWQKVQQFLALELH